MMFIYFNFSVVFMYIELKMTLYEKYKICLNRKEVTVTANNMVFITP